MYLVEHRYFAGSQWDRIQLLNAQLFSHVGLSSRSQRRGWFKQTFAEFDTEARKTDRMALT